VTSSNENVSVLRNSLGAQLSFSSGQTCRKTRFLTSSLCLSFSGNVTHHCVTAWDSLPKSYLSSPVALPKPRLLLMTTEPDALGLFRADSSCQRFDVQFLEHTEEKQSFLQESWNAMSDEERAADVQVSPFIPSSPTLVRSLDSLTHLDSWENRACLSDPKSSQTMSTQQSFHRIRTSLV
jgi:hypothetical protein